MDASRSGDRDNWQYSRQCGGQGTGRTAGNRGDKALVVSLADVKAVVEAKTLEEMQGDLKKRALVDTGLLANKSRGQDTFDSDLKAQSFADTLLTSWKRIRLR